MQSSSKSAADLLASNEFEQAQLENSIANIKPMAKSSRPSDSLAANDTEDSVKSPVDMQDCSGGETKSDSAKTSKNAADKPVAEKKEG